MFIQSVHFVTSGSHVRTREKDMGKKIIEVAEESCKAELKEEQEKSTITGNDGSLHIDSTF